MIYGVSAAETQNRFTTCTHISLHLCGASTCTFLAILVLQPGPGMISLPQWGEVPFRRSCKLRMEAREALPFPSRTLKLVISHVQDGREAEAWPKPRLWDRLTNSSCVMLKNARVVLWFYNLSQDLKGIRMFLLMIPEVKLFGVSEENSLVFKPGFLQ